MKQADVLVVGGGFAGLAAAAALSGSGRRVVLLEARREPESKFRGELIHPRGAEILGRLGLREPLTRLGTKVEGFSLQLGADRTVLLPYTDLPEGSREGLAAHHPSMLERMREALPRDVDFRAGERVVGLVREDGRVAGVRTATGDELRAGLTVIAEGRHSGLRSLLGIRERKELLSFTAVVKVENTALPTRGYGHVLLGRWGPILAYEIGPGTVRICVDVPVALVQDKRDMAEELRRECAPLIPEPLRAGVLEALRTQRVEVCANHEVFTWSCVVPGAALLGDAGGCLHPLTASGLTTALNDIQILTEELEAGGAPDRALERYQARRYRFVRARMLLAQALYEVLGTDTASTAMIRQGLWQYLHSDAQARGRALALLAGHDSRFGAFLGQYAQVLGHCLRRSASGGALVPASQSRTGVTFGLLGMLFTNIKRTAWAAYHSALG